MNDQLSSHQNQRHNSNREDVNSPQVIPYQPPIHTTPKTSTRAPNASFSVEEKLKKTNVNIFMWDVVVTMPMQKRLLQK